MVDCRLEGSRKDGQAFSSLAQPGQESQRPEAASCEGHTGSNWPITPQLSCMSLGDLQFKKRAVLKERLVFGGKPITEIQICFHVTPACQRRGRSLQVKSFNYVSLEEPDSELTTAMASFYCSNQDTGNRTEGPPPPKKKKAERVDAEYIRPFVGYQRYVPAF